MSRLRTLRSRLAGLRSQRALLRAGTGWFAVGVAVLWIVLATFLVDWTLETSVVQRLVLWLLGLLGLGWAFSRFARPHLGVTETDEDVALVVERQHGVDTDLIAAMQFESSAAGNWGSTQLRTAVVDCVADFSNELDVYEGLDRTAFGRRAVLLAVTVVVVVAGVLLAPGHAGAFASRMLLARTHYPTATRIESITVNGTTVFPVADDEEFDSLRQLAVVAQSGSMVELELAHDAARSASDTSDSWFDAWFGPDEPTANAARELSELCRRQNQVVARMLAYSADEDLSPVFRDQRRIAESLDGLVGRAELDDIRDALDAARTAAHESVAAVGRLGPSVPHGQELEIELVLSGEIPESGGVNVFDLDSGSGTVLEFQKRAGESPAEQGDSSDDSAERATFVATLPRFVDAVRYDVHVGDAWTEPRLIGVVPLPVVSVEMQPTPPAYAARAAAPSVPGQLQQSVVEGSRIDFAVRCTNKRLASAVVEIDEEQYPLQPDEDRRTWRLDVTDTPFAEVRNAVRFAVRVEDADGLSLERPLQGFVRIKPDRPPRISADIKYGLPIALPNATRSLDYRATDDYGLSRVSVLLEVSKSDGSTSRDVRLLYDRTSGRPTDEITAAYTLDFEPLGLVEGDQLKLTFEAHDHRGSATPATAVSEPIAFRIGNEVEVLREMQKLDERAERDLDAIIRRELGIGESP